MNRTPLSDSEFAALAHDADRIEEILGEWNPHAKRVRDELEVRRLEREAALAAGEDLS